MPNLTTCTIYVPQPDNASDADRWEIVAASLRAAGVRDIRPAPMPAQNFLPKHARPVLLSSAEV
jgi:hypothetical protein